MPAPFADRIMTVTDAGDGSLSVYDPGTGVTSAILIDSIQNIINNTQDATFAYAYNFAVRLGLSGITNVRNPDGTVNPAALSLLNSISFKVYQ